MHERPRRRRLQPKQGSPHTADGPPSNNPCACQLMDRLREFKRIVFEQKHKQGLATAKHSVHMAQGLVMCSHRRQC